MYGWRGKIGVILPSNNTVLEPEFYRVLPEGVSAHFARMLTAGSSAEALLEMVRNAERAAQELAAANVDTLLYACLSTSLAKGFGWDAEFAGHVELRTGRRCETAAVATIRALRSLGAQRIALATPYPEDIHRRLPGFLAQHGLEVVAHGNLGIADVLDVCRREPREAYALARSVWKEGAEAICIVATDFRTLEIIDPLEQDLGVPVVTTNQALLWAALQALGVCQPIPGFGRLLGRGRAEPENPEGWR